MKYEVFYEKVTDIEAILEEKIEGKKEKRKNEKQ